MARDENLPFDLGTTYFGGDTAAIDANVGAHLEGQEYWVEDQNYATGGSGAQSARSHRKRKVRIVRNMNATAALPKELHKFKTDGTTGNVLSGQIDGKTTSVATKGAPVDEFLGTAGCLQYDLCYVVIDGLAKVTTEASGTVAIAIGDVIIPGATTNGKALELDTTATGATLFNQVFNAIGRAAEAVTTNSTDFLVDVGAHRR